MRSSRNHVSAGEARRNAQILLPVTLPVLKMKKKKKRKQENIEGDKAFPRCLAAKWLLLKTTISKASKNKSHKKLTGIQNTCDQ